MRLIVSALLKRAPIGALFAYRFGMFLLGVVFSLPIWALCPLESTVQKAEAVFVESVTDGDTVRLKDGRRIRIIGINTPEVSHGNGPAEPISGKARKALARLVEKQQGFLVPGKEPKDHYGRTLAHIFTANKDNVTAHLLRSGVGFQVAIPPNLRYFECYQEAEKFAHEQRLGVWNHPYFQPIPSTSDTIKGGYARIVGLVERVHLTKKTVWIDLEGQVTLKLEKRYGKYVDPLLLDALVQASKMGKGKSGITFEVRGWLSDRNTWQGSMPELVKQGKRKRFQMKIHHQLSWKQLDAGKTVN